MPFATLLSIKVDGEEILTSYSARALTAAMDPIPQAADLVRDINATLHDLSMPQFKMKRNMTISCTDFESVGFDRFPPGTLCTVQVLPNLGVRPDEDSVPLTLFMMMGLWHEEFDEWAARNTWALPLQEV